MDWDHLRALFPAVEAHTYLNTASGGALSTPARDAARQYLHELHAQADIPWTDWLERAEQVRGAAARLIGAAPEEVAFLPNASLGLNYAAQLLHGPGEVLALTEDFPSVTLPWLQQGRPLRFLHTDADGRMPVERLAESIGAESAVLATSLVQYRTGFRHDLRAVGALCRERGLALVVDATQGLGAMGVDVVRDEVDVLVCSGYKWLTAGYGIALLYIRNERLAGRPLPAFGWRSAADPNQLRNDRLEPAPHATALELGHPPLPGIFTLGGALSVLQSAGMDRIEARIQGLNDHLHRQMDGAGIGILSVRDPAHRSGITMVSVDNPVAAVEALKAQNIYVAARGGAIRVALHFYNSTADIDRFTDVLRTVVRR